MSDDFSRFQEISCHTFNAVGGDQNIYNNCSVAPVGLTPAEFPPGEEWKVELYKEYRRVPIGECYLLRTICSETSQRFLRWRNEEDSQSNNSDDTRLVFSIARVGDGQSNSPKLAVVYKGRNAKEAFKEDCIGFSRVRNVNVAQLYGFNDSDKGSPMIFFHDELIPLEHLFQSHRNCDFTLMQYLSFHVSLIPEGSVPFFGAHVNWSNVWVRPQDGLIIVGPEGPYVHSIYNWAYNYKALDGARETRISGPIWLQVRVTDPGVDRSWSLARQHFASAIPLHLYNTQSLLRYLADQILHGLYDPEFSATLKGIEPPPLASEYVLPASIWTSPQVIARFPFSDGVPYLGKYGRGNWELQDSCCPRIETIGRCYFESQGSSSRCNGRRHVLMEDGRIRISHHQQHGCISRKHSFTFKRSDQHKLSSIWVAQALHVFSTLGIRRNRWSDYGYLSSVEFTLESETYTDTVYFRFGGGKPFYLFTDPLQWPINDLSHTASGTDSTFYYWSFDPHGRTVMSESERVARRLPSYVPKVEVLVSTWRPATYDFMRELQEAQGFDPMTTDFVRAMKYPILEIIHNYEEDGYGLENDSDLDELDYSSSDSFTLGYGSDEDLMNTLVSDGSDSSSSCSSFNSSTSGYGSDEDPTDTGSPPCFDFGDSLAPPVRGATDSMGTDAIMEDLASRFEHLSVTSE